MGKFEMNQQFENRKNGRIAHVAMIDDVHKTINLMYDERNEKDSETGFCLSYPSVSKNWKRLDTFYSANESNEIVSNDDTCSDGTSYSLMSEILVDENVQKKASKKNLDKKKVADSNNSSMNDVLDFIYSVVSTLGGEVGIPRDESMKFRALRKTGKQFCKLVWSGKSVKLCVKELLNYSHKVVNYNLPNQYVFTTFDESTKTAIHEILTTSFTRCNNKEEK
jgi:hypothetical protein